MSAEALTYLEARGRARAEKREGELIGRFWREGDSWHVQYVKVQDVGGYRTFVNGRIETVGPVKRAPL